MFSKSYDEVFQCKVSKKKFLGTATRYLFIFAEYVVINKVSSICYNKEHNKKKADRVFYVAQTKRIVWKYSQEK